MFLLLSIDKKEVDSRSAWSRFSQQINNLTSQVTKQTEKEEREKSLKMSKQIKWMNEWVKKKDEDKEEK